MMDYIATHSRLFVSVFFYAGIAVFPMTATFFAYMGEKDLNRVRGKILAYTAMSIIIFGAVYSFSVAIIIYSFATNISVPEKMFIACGVLYYISYMHNPLKGTKMVLSRIKTYGVWPIARTVFISYRTVDVQFVRLLSEQLIARGVPIWFDEYYITTANKENLLNDNTIFGLIIDKAIRKSKAAICFTNEAYAASQYCKQEASSLYSKLGKKRILNIACPRYKELEDFVPGLANCKIFEFNDAPNLISESEFTGLWRVLAEHCAIAHEPLLLKSDSPKEVVMEWLYSIRYSLDLGGWQGTTVFEKRNGHGMDVVGGRYKQIVGKLHLILYVVAGIYAGEPRGKDNEKAERERFIVSTGKEWDDYMKTSALMDLTKLIGTHFINVQGRGHAAFSTYDESMDLWQRHYVIVLPNPAFVKCDLTYGQQLEFSLQFTLLGGATFQEFCSIGYLMDRVVSSFRILSN